MDLRVVQALGRLVAHRWKLSLGFLARDGSILSVVSSDGPLRQGNGDELTRLARGSRRSVTIETTRAGLRELACPIVVDGSVLGFVLCGGYHPNPGAQPRAPGEASPTAVADVGGAKAPVLGGVDEANLREVVALLAQEVVQFQLEIAGVDRRSTARTAGATKYDYSDIIGRSPPMAALYRLLDKVIDSDSTVLIQGDNGTGKELIAKAIHFNSWRKDRRFVVQNCSAFNDNLLDSELFGHKKGAFTGAIADKRGLFEVADGSTFFLDEIGDMSAALQVKLLRVLQEGTFIPVGDTQPKTVDVRIIAATNRDLKQMVEQGAFREDLYYRINVINIRIPRLRERKEDIPLLVDHFLRKQAKGNRSELKQLTHDCFKRLGDYHWPGNVRELENEIERLVVLAGDDRRVGEELLSPRIRKPGDVAYVPGAVGSPRGLPEAVQALERSMIYDVLTRNHWNKTRAAEELRISRRNLIRKVNKYQLDQRRARQ